MEGEILLNIRANLKGMETSFNKVSADVNKLQKHIESLSNGISSVEKDIGKTATNLESSFKNVTTSTKKATDGIQTFSDELNKADMDLLGVGFFAVMLQRVFQGVMQAGTSTFLSLSAGTTLVSENFARFNAQLNYAKFLLGNAIMSALEPLISLAIDLLGWFNELTPSAQRLVGQVTILGLAFSAALSWLGFMVLGFQSLENVYIKYLKPLYTILAIDMVAGLASVKEGLTLLFSGSILSGLSKLRTGIALILAPLLKVIGVLAVIYTAWLLYNDIIEKNKNIHDDWWGLVKKSLGLANESVSDITGNTDDLWDSFSANILAVGQAMVSTFIYVGKIIYDVLMAPFRDFGNMIVTLLRGLSGEIPLREMGESLLSTFSDGLTANMINTLKSATNAFFEQTGAAVNNLYSTRFREGSFVGTVEIRKMMEQGKLSNEDLVGYLEQRPFDARTLVDFGIAASVLTEDLKNFKYLAEKISTDVSSSAGGLPDSPAFTGGSGDTTTNNNVVVVQQDGINDYFKKIGMPQHMIDQANEAMRGGSAYDLNYGG